MERKPDNTRWTGEKASAFLKLLARHGKVARAARDVGMSRQAAYRLRARAPQFAAFWEDALELARRRRASSRRGRSIHPLLAPGPASAPEAGEWPNDGSGPQAWVKYCAFPVTLCVPEVTLRRAGARFFRAG